MWRRAVFLGKEKEYHEYLRGVLWSLSPGYLDSYSSPVTIEENYKGCLYVKH
jgi:hypothetical protein